jgi:hypothetical protein
MAQKISRRSLLATGAVAVAAPAVLRIIPAEAQSNVIKIGHVSPKTGPLAGFGEADGFILGLGPRHPGQGTCQQRQDLQGRDRIEG